MQATTHKMKLEFPLRVPQLKHDAMMKEKWNQEVHELGRLERLVMFACLKHLRARGFEVREVHDGDDWKRVHSIKGAMELAFNLDECLVRVSQVGTRRDGHRIFFVWGNDGWDSINDWSYADGDPDGFDAAMEDFDPELVIELQLKGGE